MELPLTRKDCAVAVTHHNKRRQLNAAVLGSNIASLKHDQSFAAFQSNCASNYDTDLYFTAEGIGTSVVQLKCLFPNWHSCLLSHWHSCLLLVNAFLTFCVNWHFCFNRNFCYNCYVSVLTMLSGKGGLVRIRPYNLVGLIGSNIGDVMMMMCLVLSNDRLWWLSYIWWWCIVIML